MPGLAQLHAGLLACVVVLTGGGCARPYVPVNDPLLRAGEGECVVLLHGLARRPGSMKSMADALRVQGYIVINDGYPSRKAPVATLSAETIPAALDRCRKAGATRIHMVTHSLGGILVRAWLEQHEIARFGRLVMLAPPNHGSGVIEVFGRVPLLFDLINGPAGAELGTGPDSVPNRLGPIQVETAVLTGTRTFNPILSLSLPNPDDGKVSVASSRLDGMCAHLTLPVAHPFIMQDGQAIRETIHFLASGELAAASAERLACDARQHPTS